MISKDILNKAIYKIKQQKQHAEQIADKNLQKALLNTEFLNIYQLEKTALIENAKCEVYNQKKLYNIRH